MGVVPRLTPTEVAAIPMLLQQHRGNVSEVARQLGVTKHAIQRRVPKMPKVPAPSSRDVAAISPATEDPGAQERQIARGLLLQAGKLANANPTVRDLVHAAQGLIDLANSRDKAHQLALTYVDQRSVTVQGAPMREEVLEAAVDRVVAEVVPLLCPACRAAVEAQEAQG